MKWKGVILGGGEGAGEEQEDPHRTIATVTAVDESTADEGEQITTAIKPNAAINFSGYKV